MGEVTPLRLRVAPAQVAVKDRVSYRCFEGDHEKCSGVIMVAGNHAKRSPREVLCDCEDPSCTCRSRALG